MLNPIMKNAQKQYFWWIGNRTAPNKRVLLYFFPKDSDNASGEFSTEMEPLAKWGQRSPAPLLTARCFYRPWKATAQFKHDYPHPIVTAHSRHSGSAFSQARSILQETDNAVWPYQYTNVTEGNYLNCERNKRSGILRVTFLNLWITLEFLLHQHLTCREACSTFWSRVGTHPFLL